MPGTYVNLGGCVNCPIGCATCTSTACLTCNLPFISSTPAGQCICSSVNLLYYDPANQTCSSCTSIMGSNCTSCTSSNYTTVCQACTSGSYLSNGTCVVCPYPCTTCSSPTVCSACSSTYTLINSTCICDTSNQLFLDNSTSLCASCAALTTSICLSCSSNPAATNSSGVACTSCPNGYFSDPSTYLCTSCPSTCSLCTSLLACSQCQDTYSLINNTCICDVSSQIFYYGGGCLACYSIVNYCQQCDNSSGTVLCTSCGAGTYLSADQKTCVVCPVNCDSCTSLGCSNCSAGYVSVAGVC